MKRKCCKRCDILYAKNLQSEKGVFDLSLNKPDWLPSVCFCSGDSVSRWGQVVAP